MPDSDAPAPNDPWADLPTPEQVSLTPPPLPSVEIREPVVDVPPTAAFENTIPIEVPPEAVEPPATVFTGPPQGLTDPTVAVPPIVAAPEFVAEPDPVDTGEATAESDDDSAEPPLVDRTGRDSGGVAFAGLGLLLWAGIIGATWWAVTGSPDPMVDPNVLASPRTTWDTFREFVVLREFWDQVWATSLRLAISLLIGAGAGLAIGAVVGHFPRFGRLIRPLPGVLRLGVPATALPLLILARGMGEEVLIIPAALAAFAAVAHTTADAHIGVRSGALRSRGPAVVAGLRAALPLAWMLLFFTELVVARDGVGRAAFSSQVLLRSDLVIVWLLVGLVLVFLIDLLLQLLQHLVRPGRRDDVPPPLR